MVTRAVHSVLNQGVPVDQIVVVDDGSAQPQLPELHALAEAGRVVLVREANRGVNGACNRGARELTTDFMLVLGDDDILLPNAIGVLSAVLQADASAVGAVGAGRRYFARAGGEFGPVEMPSRRHWEFDDLIRGNPFFAGAVLFRRSAFLAIGGYEEEVAVVEDWDLWLRLSRHGHFTVCPEEVIHYTVHEGNASGTSKVAAMTLRLVEHHLGGWPPRERAAYLPSLGTYLAGTYWSSTLWHARAAAREGQLRSAIADLAIVARISWLAARSAPGRRALKAAWSRHWHPEDVG